MVEEFPNTRSVDIIIPCYNQEDYIEECMVSCINQNTEIDISVIVVDDCSTDDSSAIIKKYVSMYPFIKYVKTTKNSKLPAVRNIGIEVSDSDYIVCLDGDDKLPPNYIQRNYDNLINNDVDISYNPSQCFGHTNGRYNWIDFDPNVLQHDNYIHASAMFKRDVWNKVNGYDEELILGWEDYSFWLKALKEGFKFKRTLQTFLLWRQQESNQMTKTVTKDNTNEIKKQLKDIHKDFYLGT